MSAPYSIDLLTVDVGNVVHLLDEAVEVSSDLDFGIGQARNHRLDRVMALVTIALDIAKATEAKVGANYGVLARRV